MSSYVKKVHKKNLTKIDEYVHSQLAYEVIMGSFAYGVSSDVSDIDIYGFCIPNKNIIFPHLTGKYIFGYDKEVLGHFEQWQQHHIKMDEKEFDFSIYNITKYFALCVDGNPNMIDSLFVPRRCISYMNQVGNLVRENRHLFLSKKCWHTYKGYAYSQLHKMKSKNPQGKRQQIIEEFGYDVKFAYHLVRLLNEIEQILLECDLDLERNKEQLKAIRRGDWSQKQVEEYFEQKEKDLESLYIKSDLPNRARKDEVRELLFDCLELHFGQIEYRKQKPDKKQKIILNEIEKVLERNL